MISNIGLKATTECVSQHPFILSEGEHISHVSPNILVEQMQFYTLRNKITDGILDFDAKKPVKKTFFKYWNFYGMLRGESSVIEEAIQKGLRLNYEVLYKEVDKFIENDEYDINSDFLNNFESLRQLSEVKLIESKLLALFDKEIQRETDTGSVAILQGITSTTDFIYSMYPTGLPLFTDMMKNISSVNFFKKVEKGRLISKVVDKTREEALSEYLNIPTQLLDQMFEVTNDVDLSKEDVENLVDSIIDFVTNLNDLNEAYADAFKQASTPIVDNESQTYEISDKKREDDYSIM